MWVQVLPVTRRIPNQRLVLRRYCTSITAMPPPAKPTGAILWLHDVGEADPNEFARIGLLTSNLPWLSVHCPACPGGRPKYEWIDHRAPPAPSGEPQGLAEALKAVHERVEHLMDVMGIDSSRILLGGFGQGGAHDRPRRFGSERSGPSPATGGEFGPQRLHGGC